MSAPHAPLPPHGDADEDEALRPVLRMLGSHPALLTGAVVALLFPAKLLRVGRGDLITALAVLEASDKSDAAAGILVLALPAMVVVAWFATAMALGRSLSTLRNPATTDGARGRTLAILVLLTPPTAVLFWLLLAMCPRRDAMSTFVVGGILVIWESRRRPRRRPPGRLDRALSQPRPSTRTALIAVGAVGAASLVVADLALSRLLDDTMWLPTRSVAVSARAPAPAYVLSRDASSVTLLWDHDRRVERIALDDVVSEHLCQPQVTLDRRSFWDVSRHRRGPGVPAC
jgi:hypothetical protein